MMRSSAAVKSCVMGMQKRMPIIAMIFSQFIYAAMFLLSKAAVSSGMKPSIFVSYRQAIATLVLAPISYFSHRERSPPLTLYFLCKIWIVSSCGMALSLNLSYSALNYVSATFVTAITNTIPATVFIIAVSFRIEELAITKRHGWAKIIGSALGLAGAMVFTFYSGPPLYSGHQKQVQNSSPERHSREDWIKGSLLQIAANLTWASWLIMQTPILKEYPAKLRLTALQCGFSSLSSVIYAAAVERNILSWKLGWNVHLLAVAYCVYFFLAVSLFLQGIVVTAISYSLQVWVVEKRGPVFTSVFSPLALILTAIFSAIIFHETLHWGSVVGGVMVVAGLYAFLWGKNKEVQGGAGARQQKSDPPKEETHLESIAISSNPPNDEQLNDTPRI